MKCRSILWYLVFTGSILTMINMSNMNIAIVAMVRKVTTMNGLNVSDVVCKSNGTFDVNATERESSNVDLKLHQSMFDWNGHEQSMVLGSVYWLGWIANIPGGVLANKFGPKIVFGVSNFLASLLSFICPMATYYHINALIVVRAIQGLLLGLTFACLHTITARWIPPNERGSFITSYLGGTVAVAVGYPYFGWISSVRRWDDIFYSCGWFGVIWTLIWYYFMHDSPRQHPRISEEEQEYIEKSLGTTLNRKPSVTPWTRLLLSSQVWLNILANFAFMWMFFLLHVYIPLYFRMVHDLKFSSTALIAGLPHVVRLVVSLVSSTTTDYLMVKQKLSRTIVRKISTAICLIGPGIFLIILSRTGCNTALAVAFVFFAVSCTAFPNSGFYATMVDISPNFCSIIYGISLTVGTLTGVLLTSYVGWMTQHNSASIEQWQSVFQFIAYIGIFSGLLYFVFAKADVLSWNNPEHVRDTEMTDLKNNNEPSEGFPLKSET